MRKKVEETVRLETEKEDLRLTKGRLENELRTVRTQLENLRRTSQDSDEKRKEELEMMAKEIEVLSSREREAKNQIILVENELEHNKNEFAKVKRENDSLKADCEQMMKMLENFETKVNLHKVNEEKASKALKEAKEKMDEAILQKDKALIKEEQYNMSLENLKARHREEVANMKEQYEKVIEGIKTKSKIQQDKYDEEISHANRDLVEAQSKIDNLIRENHSLKNDLVKFDTSLLTDGGFGGTVDFNLQRVHELEEKLLDQDRIYNEKLHRLTVDKSQGDMTVRNLQNQLMELRSTLDTEKKEKGLMNGELSSLKSKMHASLKDKQGFLDEMQRIKKSYDEQLAVYTEEYNTRLREMEERLHDTVRQEKIAREKSVELLKHHERVNPSLPRHFV